MMSLVLVMRLVMWLVEGGASDDVVGGSGASCAVVSTVAGDVAGV